MTEPIRQKPRLLPELRLSDISPELARQDSWFPLDHYLNLPTFQLELFQSNFLPQNGSCGLLRNNSAFGCSYLNAQGRETKLGMNINTYPGGLGLSLKIFLNP